MSHEQEQDDIRPISVRSILCKSRSYWAQEDLDYLDENFRLFHAYGYTIAYLGHPGFMRWEYQIKRSSGQVILDTIPADELTGRIEEIVVREKEVRAQDAKHNPSGITYMRV